MSAELYHAGVAVCATCGSPWTIHTDSPSADAYMCYLCQHNTVQHLTPITLDGGDYELVVEETAIYPESGSKSLTALMYAVLGLTGESGEVADKLKKVLREDKTLEDAREGLIAELGDVLWYVHRVATELGVSLEEVQGYNATKLLSRKSRDMLKGSGDDR